MPRIAVTDLINQWYDRIVTLSGKKQAKKVLTRSSSLFPDGPLVLLGERIERQIAMHETVHAEAIARLVHAHRQALATATAPVTVHTNNAWWLRKVLCDRHANMILRGMRYEPDVCLHCRGERLGVVAQRADDLRRAVAARNHYQQAQEYASDATDATETPQTISQHHAAVRKAEAALWIALDALTTMGGDAL